MNNENDTTPGTLNLFTTHQPQSTTIQITDNFNEVPSIHPSTLIIDEPNIKHLDSLDNYVTIKSPTEQISKQQPKKRLGFFTRWFRRFKRILMKFRRGRKKYNIWRHKLGKIEMDPVVRQEFRTQRKAVSDIFKLIDAVLDTVDKQADRVEKMEEFTKSADEVLTALQEKTAMMR
jgi:hypothetical protein